MGSSSYDFQSRSARASTKGYGSGDTNKIFTQQAEQKAHVDMLPKNVVFRESRDSGVHPNSFPLQFYLDVTGSMGMIPHEMIASGLPKMVGKLIQNGVPDIALMFGAVGDHECDRCPLQVGQFESGDAELDMWLTRTWLEKGGGGNAGESYPLAWYFAANHTRTDAWDKRKQKGVVITCGDEPFLKNFPASAIKAIMGDAAVGQGNFTAEELLKAAQEKNHVFHVHIAHGGRRLDPAWKELLGDNLIVLEDYTKISDIISDIVLSVVKQETSSMPVTAKPASDTKTDEEML